MNYYLSPQIIEHNEKENTTYDVRIQIMAWLGTGTNKHTDLLSHKEMTRYHKDK